ncbi:hypothetical protein H5410_059719 [Solanum commersonii]|uniref:Uncharacterized protein n=1 Tax=Solanum commersonii TaxID=4109 RepID=A0A9J5W3G7_SOLCO|nr:hypothetical protein H5410_059719 [Solanum commersonii]
MKVITCFTFQFSEDDMNAESQFLVNNPSQPSEKIRSLVTKKIHVQPACTSVSNHCIACPWETKDGDLPCQHDATLMSHQREAWAAE